MPQFDSPIKLMLQQQQIVNNGKIKIHKARKMFTGITLELEYQRRLRKLVISNMKEEINTILLPQLQHILDDADLLRPEVRTDAFSDIIVSAMISLRNGFGRAVTGFSIAALARRIAEMTSDFQRQQLDNSIISQIGVNVFLAEPWLQDELAAFVERNVALITTVSTKAFSEIEEIVFRGATQGLSVSTMVDQIKERMDIATSRANLIARDQVNKFFGQLNALRQKSLGVEEYIWRSADDNRVRPTHVTNDDRTFKWNNPPAATGHPGEDIQCRCYAEPKLSTLIRAA